MKQRCQLSHDETIDLADMQGVVQKLSDQTIDTYASDFLQPRGNYVLIKAIKRLDDNGQFCKEYIPLLDGIESSNPEFFARLSNKKVNPDAFSKDIKETSRMNPRKKGNDGRLSTNKTKSNINVSGDSQRRRISTRPA